MQNVRVRSSDGEEFSLTIEVAYRSKKIKAICMHQGLNEPVTLSEVNGLILEKAIRWMERYKVSKCSNLKPRNFEFKTFQYFPIA